MRCALIDLSTNLVTNVIMADPSVDPAPEGFTIIGLPDDSPVSIGWLYDGSSFIDPNPPIIEPDPPLEEPIVP